MAYEFELDETPATAVRRIAREEVATAVDLLAVAGRESDGDTGGTAVEDAGGVTTADAVHEARKCCKRLRGLVRLVRPALGEAYAVANRQARDASRELSEIRDAHALVETFDHLVAARADQVPAGGLAPLRRALVARAEQASDRLGDDRVRIDLARGRLERLGGAVSTWPLGEDREELSDAMAAGMERTARRARDRFAEVVAEDGRAGDHLLHQWRKRVKYSWYHACLLEPAAPTLVGVEADLLHDLSDALGDDHDLAVLSADLRADPASWGGDDVVDGALVLVDGTRADLQRRAVAVGARVHAEDPAARGRRLVALLASWWEHGPERPAGEIADLHPVDDDLGDHTNGRLRELARSRDLAGRSSLDRAGLLAALRADGAV